MNYDDAVKAATTLRSEHARAERFAVRAFAAERALTEAQSRLTSIEVAAERACAKGYDLDPFEVMEMLGKPDPTTDPISHERIDQELSFDWGEIAVYRGKDGALVVHVDTSGNVGHVRINLNEAAIFDADPEVGP